MLWGVLLAALHACAGLWSYWQRAAGLFLRLFLAVTQPVSVEKLPDIVRGFAKTPRHLCIAVVEDQLHYQDLATLVAWAVAARIPYISVWDPTGALHASRAMRS